MTELRKLLKNLQERFKTVGIDPTVDRWSEGIDHHPEVVKLIENAHEISCDWQASCKGYNLRQMFEIAPDIFFIKWN